MTMKVICKSNNFIAIPTRKKSECLYLLGQYLNKDNCEIEMDSDEVRSITCKKYTDENHKWTTTITLQTKIPYDSCYIILDLKGNLVNVVTEEQFKNQYAILQDEID